jgi:predicted thioesterase
MLNIGIKGTKTEMVTNENTAAHLGSGDLQVYGTPAMIALMESAALESVQPYLEPVQQRSGSDWKSSTSPFSAGNENFLRSTLIEIDRRMLTFEISVFDEKGEIGRGIISDLSFKRILFCRKLWRGNRPILPDNQRNKNNYDFPEKNF